MRLIFLPILILSVLSANGQALWRNFFTTNQNPIVTVVAGSNSTVQASTVGVNQRVFTVNSVPTTNVAYSGFATNASNATNVWSILSPTNIPPLAYISNNVGNGTNVTLWGSNNVSRADGLGTTITPTIWLTNGTAAALGAQQNSPVVMWTGRGYRSGNSSEMPVSLGLGIIPTEGSSANPQATLHLFKSISNAALSQVGISFNDSGVVAASGGFSSTGGGITLGSAAFVSWASRSVIYSPANGDIQLYNSANNAFSRLFFGKLTADWPMIKVESSTNNPTLSVRTGADGNYASLMASNVTASFNLTATNFVNGSYGCLTMGTGTVTVATSASTNLFTAASYSDSFGSVGIETNCNFVVTNAAKVRISFGAGLMGGNGNVVKALVFTNDVHCGIVSFVKTMQNPAIAETGFKEFTVSVPALCRISLRIANESAAGVDVQNLCFNVKGAN